MLHLICCVKCTVFALSKSYITLPRFYITYHSAPFCVRKVGVWIITSNEPEKSITSHVTNNFLTHSQLSDSRDRSTMRICNQSSLVKNWKMFSRSKNKNRLQLTYNLLSIVINVVRAMRTMLVTLCATFTSVKKNIKILRLANIDGKNMVYKTKSQINASQF